MKSDVVWTAFSAPVKSQIQKPNWIEWVLLYATLNFCKHWHLKKNLILNGIVLIELDDIYLQFTVAESLLQLSITGIYLYNATAMKFDNFYFIFVIYRAAALPYMFETCKKLHIHESVTSFGVPMATTINATGSSVFICAAMIFLSQINHMSLNVGEIITLGLVNNKQIPIKINPFQKKHKR